MKNNSCISAWNTYVQILLILILLIFSTSITAQERNIVIEGRVVDKNGKEIPYATIALDGKYKGTVSNNEGEFKFAHLNPGKYSITVQCLGYNTISKEIVVNKEGPNSFTIILENSDQQLNEIVITQKSITTQTKQKSFTVMAIDAKPLQNLNQDINATLGQATGVRIREEGGLGSSFSFSLNGFTGRQVKFFLDGIPMDYVGSSLSLNNIPINLAERIEVYKGVVPVHLGSDALGGAVNIVTRQDISSYVDVSYTTGSFHTHKASVLSRVRNKKTGFVFSTNSFLNYSQNNYLVDVELYDVDSKSFIGRKNVSRFNDAYKSGTIQTELGLTDKKFADKLLIGLTASGNYKEIQNGVNMNLVAGQVYTRNKIFMPSLKYKKSDLFIDRLNVTYYASYSDGESLIADSSSRQYNWSGEYTVESIGTSGELSRDKTLFTFNDNNIISSINLSYSIIKNHSFSVNHNYYWFKREGNDPLSPYIIPFDEPNIMHKHIAGLGYKFDALSKKLSTNIFAKLFFMNANVIYAEWGEYEKNNKKFNRQSFGIASTYFLFPNMQLKTSFENTYRLPEVYEIMGDGFLLKNSPYLEPESSKNYNAGFLMQHINSRNRFELEGNYLYRVAKGLIRLDVEAITTQYKNLRNASINCLEGYARYGHKKLLDIELNVTYQNMVNLDNETGYYGIRLPNTPYLFGNFKTSLSFEDLGIKESTMGLIYNTQYVESFYLKWPNLGVPSSKYTIPRQVSHNISLSYSFQKRYNLTFECRNLADIALYDNYALQKPGRAFYVKLRYYFTK